MFMKGFKGLFGYNVQFSFYLLLQRNKKKSVLSILHVFTSVQLLVKDAPTEMHNKKPKNNRRIQFLRNDYATVTHYIQ